MADCGGTWQNGTYDDYNYQYQWTKTWQGQGEPEVSSSASNHVTGLENGSATGWWTDTDGQGNSSSTSGGGPWSDSYDETVNDPGFYEGAYYGWDYGGGEEEYFAYLGDAFSDYDGYDSGFFAYSSEQRVWGQSQAADGCHFQVQTEEVRMVRSGASRDSGGAEMRPSHGAGSTLPLAEVTAGQRDLDAGAGEVRANGEGAAAGDGRPPEWRWWNPFTWFRWGIDWSDAVDQEIAVVRELNRTFGTTHTRLDEFTVEERAMIEKSLGQKFNWEGASPIRASERELKIRDKVLLGSQVSLAAAGVADAAAGGVAVYEAATGTTFLVEGASVGGRIGSGGLFQIRAVGRPPLIRFDYHAIKPGGVKLPHIDSPPLGWHHWPWE